MTTRQSTTLHMSGDGEDPNNGLAFSTIDAGDPEAGAPGELRQVLEVWGTIEAPDGQLLTARMKVGMPDVRDLQAFLNDNYARNKAPKAGAEAALQTQIDGANAQYFKDGWMASLRELLEVSKVRGYEAAIDWAKGQMAAYVGPVAFSADGFPETPADLEYYAEQDAAWQPRPGDTVHIVTAQVTEAAPRQCPYISNGVQCTRPENHGTTDGLNHYLPGEGLQVQGQPMHQPEPRPAICARTDVHHHMRDSTGVQWVHDGTEADCPLPDNHYPDEVAHATYQPDVDLFQEQAAAIQRADDNHTPQDLNGNPHSVQHADNQAPRFVFGPKNAAEQARKRRLKLEIEFDDAAEKYKIDPHNPGVVAALNDAAVALHKREPDNSRVVNFLFDPSNAPAPAQTVQPQSTEPEQLPEAHFAPEPAPGHQPIPYNGGDPSLHAAEEQFEQASAQAQRAAQAFPCPHQASDGRPCQRPAGHEIELPNRPPTPHVYATTPSMMAQQATLHQVPMQESPLTGPNYPAPQQGNTATFGGQPAVFPQPHLQAVPDPQSNVAVMSFHEGEPGMPAAPVMPTWQAPQQ